MMEKKRCAIYTRKSCEEGLEQDFNSLDSQRLHAENYIKSQAGEGWEIIETPYNDGGFSGGTLARPALKQLFLDVESDLIDCVVVYKIDRLSRSLLDFSKIVDLFQKHHVSFVSVTQSFNTANSVGRLMLNVVLSFAQYERELTGERIRDKFEASRKKGMWMGGNPPLGYDVLERNLVINESEKKLVQHIFQRFLVLNSVLALARELNEAGYHSKKYKSRKGNWMGGMPFSKTTLRCILKNPVYAGKTVHKGQSYPGLHTPMIDNELWERVQSKLNTPSSNYQKKMQVPMLLKGMMQCQVCGVAMTPNYTQKKIKDTAVVKHYRYYICSNQIRGLNCAGGQGYVAAGEVEDFVVKQVRHILRSPEGTTEISILLEEAGFNTSQVFELLKNTDIVWQQLFPIEQQKVIQKLVRIVLVGPDGVEVRVRTAGLKTFVSDNMAETGI